jgi:hypothetical protein
LARDPLLRGAALIKGRLSGRFFVCGVRLPDWNGVERLRIDFFDQCGLSLANDCLDLPVRGDGSFRSLHGLRLSLANGDVKAHSTLIGRI